MVTLSAGETLQLSVSADPLGTVAFLVAGPAKHTLAATHDGGGNFSATADTATWLPGVYAMEARQTVAGVVSVVQRDFIAIQLSLADVAPGTDLRTTAQKAVENIEAMLSGSATLEARRYRINNRELERYSVSELLELLSFWKRRLMAEQRKAAGLSKLGPRIEVRI